MMLSVMVVGAGAAFSDQSKIKNTEAVDACTALNIIGGYPDGSFKPEGNITRAEVTKMICVALNGGKNPAVSTNTTPTFSDVRNNANAAWAEGYIESCAAQGIVSGVGGGKFAPNGNVTGVQLAKMLLVSLGYKSENEGFTGNAWATNVNVRAAQKGLYVGLESMDTNAAITRDNAARMVWNALNAYEVEYKTNLIAGSNGQLSTQVTVQDKVDGNFKKITLLEDKYDADTFVGIYTSNDKSNSSLKDGQIEVKGSAGTTDAGKDAIFNYDLDLKYIGEEVKVLYKDSTTEGTEGKPDTKDTIYGVFVTGETTVYNITKGDLQDADQGKIKFNDKQYKAAKAIDVYTNYKTDSASKTAAAFDKDGKTIGEYYKNSADTIKFIEKDGKITSAYIVETQFAEISSINSTKLSLSGGVSKAGIEIEDNDVYSGAKKNDIVAVQKLYDDDYYVITKANIVKADISASKSNTEVKIDGNYTKLSQTTGTAKIGDYNLLAITDLGETYEFIMYGDYWVAAQQISESAKDYAVVDKIDTNYASAVNPAVKLVKADGSKVTASIDSDSGIQKGQLVKYKTNNDGSVKMTKATSATSGKNLKKDTLNVIEKVGKFSYNKNKKQITFGDGTMVATTSDCVAFIEYENGKYSVSNADALGSFDATDGSTVYISLNKDGKAVAYKISRTGKPSTNASDDVYGYITSRGTQKDGDDTYVMLDVWTAKGNVTLKTEDLNTTQDKAFVTGAFIKFKAGTNITNASDIETVTATKIRVDEYDKDRKLLTQKNGTQWPVDKDVALITIDYSEQEGVADQFDTIPTYDSEADKCNAAIVVDDVDGVQTVVAVYIDVDSDMGN